MATSDAANDESALSSLRSCPDCGQLNQLPEVTAGAIVQCGQCGKLFRRTARHSPEKALNYAFAGFIFFIPLVMAPLLDVSVYGRIRSSQVQTGPAIFDAQQLWMLGALVIFTTLAMPLTRLGLMLTVMIGLRMRHPPKMLPHCFRWAKEVAKWAMLEVYLLGLLVAYTRLQSMVFVELDIAIYALIGVVLATALMDAALDSEVIWQEMDRRGLTNLAVQDESLPPIACETCYLLCRCPPHSHCPRCGAPLHIRKPGSLARTWALALSGAIFYLPANVYPVMSVTNLHSTTGHTIIGGMKEFLDMGMWPLALLIFTASIAIPLLKLAALVYMLITTHRQSHRHLVLRTKLYRVIDFIGRWSMVDIFMVSILVGLMRFGGIADINTGIGAPCFAAVVVFTMLAVSSFDSRLMWDAAAGRKRAQS